MDAMATLPDLWETVHMENKPELKKISDTTYGCTACKDWTVTMDVPCRRTFGCERQFSDGGKP